MIERRGRLPGQTSSMVVRRGKLPSKRKETSMVAVTGELPSKEQPTTLKEYKLSLMQIAYSPTSTPEQKAQARLQLMQIDRYHKRGYEARRTDEGFEFFKQPTPQPLWGEGYLERTRLPPPMFTASTYLQAGYGAVAGVKSTGESIAGLLGFHKPKEYTPSPFDFASPRFQDVWKKYPGILPGGALGELGQMIGIGFAGKGIKTGLVIGTKSVVAKTPTFFYKTVGKVGLPKIVQKVVYQPKFQSFWQKLYSYSKGELVFVKTFPPVGKSIYETQKGGWTWRGRMFKGFGKRTLVPTTSVPGLKEKMYGVGSFHVRYTAGKYPRTEFVAQYEKTIAKGLFRKKIKDVSASFRVGTDWAATTGKTGGFDYSKSSEFLKHITSQRSFQTVLESPYTGFVRGEKITAAIKTTAAQPIVPTIQIPSGLTQFGKAGTKGLGTSSILIPTEFVTTIPLSLVGYVPGRLSIGLAAHYLMKRRTMQTPKEIQALQPAQLPIVAPISLGGQKQIQRQKTGLTTIQTTVTKTTKPMTKPPILTKPVTTRTPLAKTVLPQYSDMQLKKPELMLEDDEYGKKYKFRKFELPSPLKGLKL